MSEPTVSPPVQRDSGGRRGADADSLMRSSFGSMSQPITVGGEIRWRMHIPVEPSVVFAALTSDEARARFWAESAIESQGVIHFRFIDGTTYESTVLEMR